MNQEVVRTSHNLREREGEKGEKKSNKLEFESRECVVCKKNQKKIEIREESCEARDRKNMAKKSVK